jgi:outer membrane lipoprotein-sorting protein
MRLAGANFLRRMPLGRLLLLCGATVAIGVFATAIALALGSGPTPPAKPLAQAVHDALAGAKSQPIQGYSAEIKLTDHLVEGSELAGGGGAGSLASSPLLTGASGRLWVGDGKMRLELQAEKGDTQIVWDGRTFTVYDAASDTVYRYTPGHGEGEGPMEQEGGAGHGDEEVPSVAKIEEAVSHIRRHARLSEATPTDVAGRPAYAVRLSPPEGGSLIGGAELSFDAENALPLRAAVYSSTSSAPVIELAASSVSYGPVDPSVFQLAPPKSARVEELSLHERAVPAKTGADEPKLSTHGHGITSIAVLEAKEKGDGSSSSLESLPKVQLGSTTASELRTELGTILTFERGGVRYVLAGAVAPAAVEALARGL